MTAEHDIARLRSDVERLEARIDDMVTEAAVEKLRDGMRDGIDKLQTDLYDNIGELHTDVRANISKLHTVSREFRAGTHGRISELHTASIMQSPLYTQ